VLRRVLQPLTRFADNKAGFHPITCQIQRPYRDAHRNARAASPGKPQRSVTMLYYAVVFLVIALIAGVLGFGGIAAGAAGIAKILFVVFLVMALVGLVAGLLKRG
jgi:uncharacterized membrane protein YtjA (UPF0391 family)